MELITILTCWAFATSEYRTVAFYLDDKRMGYVKDYLTAEDVTSKIGFELVDGETICYLNKE